MPGVLSERETRTSDRSSERERHERLLDNDLAEGGGVLRQRSPPPRRVLPSDRYADVENDEGLPRTISRTVSQPGAPPESASLTWSNFKVTVRFFANVMINMVAVYALEYMITSGFMERITLCPTSDNGFAVKAFTIFWCLYNVGVTLSRASGRGRVLVVEVLLLMLWCCCDVLL